VIGEAKPLKRGGAEGAEVKKNYCGLARMKADYFEPERWSATIGHCM
jgi:hypothetical protein